MKTARTGLSALQGKGVPKTPHKVTQANPGSKRISGAGVGSAAFRPCTVSRPRQAARQTARIRAVAEVDAPAQEEDVSVSIDNAEDSSYTVVKVEGYNRPGLLTSLSGAFRDLGLDVGKARRRFLWLYSHAYGLACRACGLCPMRC